MPDLIVGLLIAAAIALFFLWILLAIIWQVLADLVANLWNGLTGETARRKEREEVARQKEEERLEEARKEEEERQQRQQERRRERQQAEARERKQFRAENSEVFAGISKLLSICGKQVADFMRAAGVIQGADIEINPKKVIWMDVGFILVSFSKTGSLEDEYIKKLWGAVTRKIKPSDVHGTPPLSVLPNRGVEQLMLIPFLTEYDKVQETALLSKAASTYLSIVSAVSSHCGTSLAVKLVTNAYTELLRPYIHENGWGGYAGRTNASGTKSNRVAGCEKCVKGYQLLDLPFGASKGEVKQKRDALAQVLHSDHTGGMSERIRDTAEEQLKSINVAYAHILKCRFSGAAS